MTERASTVTELRATDRERWAALWRQYLAFYETELPASQYDLTWARLLDGPMHARVAREASGEMVGLTHFLFHAHGWWPGPACYLQDLFVDPAARGGGVGRALIEAVAGAAREAGASRLYWLTQADNAIARKLYEQVARHSGFIVYTHPL